MTVRIKGGRFEIEGRDLIAPLEVAPWDAALGGEAEVETIDGAKILVKVPSGIQTDSRVRVKGKGYVDRDGSRGDLFLKARIVNPRHLTHEQKELYEKLRGTVQR
jgi:curved DNA-binding protein